MATKQTGDSCYDKAGIDEPIFTLRAKDKLAPEIIREWGVKAHLHGASEEKCNEAFAVANAMEDWAKKNGSKFPD